VLRVDVVVGHLPDLAGACARRVEGKPVDVVITLHGRTEVEPGPLAVQHRAHRPVHAAGADAQLESGDLAVGQVVERALAPVLEGLLDRRLGDARHRSPPLPPPEKPGATGGKVPNSAEESTKPRPAAKADITHHHTVERGILLAFDRIARCASRIDRMSELCGFAKPRQLKTIFVILTKIP
jgi:hypothetical protein